MEANRLLASEYQAFRSELLARDAEGLHLQAQKATTQETLNKLEALSPLYEQRAADLKRLLDKNYVPRHDYLEAENHRFDCVLLDLLMPGMSGLDVLAALYGDPDAPPAIVISGQDDPDLFDRAKALNAFECHSKPIGQDTLLGAIGRALQLRHS